ncbi:MAG: hypothetical protein J5476_12830 [Lachnospiraceae bacterium]|nr:hypothetical protein [Lachnospiraceae bacterium]
MSIKIVRDTSKLNIDYTVDTAEIVSSPDVADDTELRNRLRDSIRKAETNHARSVAIPMLPSMKMSSSANLSNSASSRISIEELLRIAADEVKSLYGRIRFFFVVPDRSSDTKTLGPDLDRYIGSNFVEPEPMDETITGSKPEQKSKLRSGKHLLGAMKTSGASSSRPDSDAFFVSEKAAEYFTSKPKVEEHIQEDLLDYSEDYEEAEFSYAAPMSAPSHGFTEDSESKLAERMRHMSDTFSEYLLYLIEDKNMENSEVYKRALVDRKTFSKIKNNADYHPQKLTALCLCVGAQLNLDETKDLLARAGYALSPCDKTDIIFSFFIENEIYDMIELDIQLEEHGLPCVIS